MEITTEQIQETETFKKLEKCFQNILMKSEVRKNINYGLIAYNSTGVIPASIGGNNLKIIKEIIENEKYR